MELQPQFDQRAVAQLQLEQVAVEKRLVQFLVGPPDGDDAVGWQDWSSFGKVDVQVTSTARDASLTTDLDYQDTWHFALGTQYKPSEVWLFMFGAAYDSSAVKSADMSVACPMGETYRFGSGAQYQWNKHLSLAVSGEVAWLSTLKVDQERGPLVGRVAGEYKNAAIYAIQAGLRYQF